MLRDNNLDENEYSFLFEVLAEKHNAVIRKIREVPPWEWDGEFLELEPQVLRFLGTFSKHYPECAAFKTAYTLASALAVYRLGSRKPRSADMRPDAQPTNRRINRHKTAAKLHQGLKRIAIRFNDRRGFFSRRIFGLTVSARRAACRSG